MSTTRKGNTTVNAENAPKYQFQAVMADRRDDSGSVMVRRKLESGKWGEPGATKNSVSLRPRGTSSIV